jgi:glycosyltransferase involved in cell wall biosynthesis
MDARFEKEILLCRPSERTILMGATIPPVSRSILPLSILIRTFNEADRVGAAIGSALALGSEIIVIDAGSTDATVTICEELGAKVFHHPWSGFGPQRRYGEELCSHDYIFSLDADEVLPPDTAAEITRICSAATRRDYWLCARR